MRKLIWLGGLLLALGLLGAATAGGLAAAPRPAGPAGGGPGGQVIPVGDGFEGGDLLVTQFVVATPTCAPGGCGWAVVTTDHHTGTHSVFAPDLAGVADQQLLLNSPVAIPANATSASLTWWQRYGFEASGTNYYDGGVFEISTDHGLTWADGGSAITSGGYNVTLFTGSGNPLGGRAAWGGNPLGGWSEVRVDLSAYIGTALRFRFRLGTDSSGAGAGWWIDDAFLSYLSPVPCGASSWSPVTPVPTAVDGPAVAAQGGLLYSFGGRSTGGVVGTASRYDPAADTWTARAALPAARAGAGAVSDGTYLYILGGTDAGSAVTSTFWRYDPVADTYTPLATLPAPAYFPGVALVGGKIYVIGGFSAPGVPSATAAAYNLGSGTWTPIAPYPVATGALLALGYDGYVYAAGGAVLGPSGKARPDLLSAGVPTSPLVVTTKALRYDPATDAWDDAGLADLPGPRAGAAGGWYHGRWLLAGGTSTDMDALGGAVAWNPATNAWASAAQVFAPVALPGGASAGNAFYVVGGISGGLSGPLATTQHYIESPCAAPVLCPLTFSDVHAADYFYAPVLYLACHGVISGYGDGTFRPYANTTRAQLVKITVLGFGLPAATPTGGAYTFADVPPAAPFWSLIETAVHAGIVGGYACGGPGEPCMPPANRAYFRPNANVTRGQLSKITAGAAGWPLQHPALASFADVPVGSPFFPFVETAACYHVVSGYLCGGPGEPCDPALRPYFRPAAKGTRGQIAKIVFTAVQYPAPCGP